MGRKGAAKLVGRARFEKNGVEEAEMQAGLSCHGT